ncbi:MAG: beta-ketoacyl synthase chain length factor [Bacteroidales bacterium]|nr:beta-ketoacyl synthase chain length factor [Bacteroidales bacterium]
MMNAYIKSTGAITPQPTFDESFPWKENMPANLRMNAIEPEYKNYIPPVKLRRMSRVVKMGLCAAIACLKKADLEQPDAIITTTGWGCLADTFRFLDEIVEKNEQTLSPATFIQSTHNTVGGQIALLLGCQEYNSVYVNSNSSFEHGLLDSILLLNEGKENVLLGGIDEFNETDFNLKKQAGYWKNEDDDLQILPNSKTTGTISGEGSAFFLLTDKEDSSIYAKIDGVKIFSGDPDQKLQNIFQENNICADDIQLVISGINGDSLKNNQYVGFYNRMLPSACKCCYKHLCGEHDSASAFALWLAEAVLRTQVLPEYLSWDQRIYDQKQINRILIHHYNTPDEHAFILVSKTNI